jgi:OmcA/MtrC family decaheme c-type cytochrome
MRLFRGSIWLGFGVLLVLAVGVSLGFFDSAPAVFAVESADLNDDQMVNGQDLLLLQEQWMTDGDVVTPPEARPSSEVLSVVIPEDLRPEITFSLQDANGVPLPATGVTTNWILAKVVEDNVGQMRTHYESYTTREVSNAAGPFPIGSVTAQQANYAPGVRTDLGNGQYLFKFNNPIQGYDPSLTHTVGAQIERRVGGQHTIVPINPLYTFRPDGGTVTNVRELTSTMTCNACHDRLELHGGGRREYGLCVLCHNPAEGNIDPDSGNSIDMGEMVHKIHRGVNLPSVASGSDYIIYGFGNTPHNYSHVVFPQDIRNCGACHTGPQADYHQQVPSRRACGACHDDVNFDTGEGHATGIPQANDNGCTACHPATGTPPFGASVQEAHLPPRKDPNFPTWTAEILGVANAVPGGTPEVTFSLLQEIAGATSVVVFPTDVNRLRINVTPVDVDFGDYETFTASTANTTDHGDGTFTMVLGPLAATAEGTLAFGMEGRGNSLAQFDNLRPVIAPNPIAFAAVTGELTPRRTIVDDAKCSACHDLLLFHGSNRSSAMYCAFCHRPEESNSGDEEPGEDPVSINFSYMIHKIHTGEELENGYTLGDFSHVVFPGDRKNCEMCHVPGSYDVPIVAGAHNVTVTNVTGTVVLDLIPETAACTSCHDGNDAVAHALDSETIVGLPGGGMNCAACHGEDAAIAVMEAHKKGF